MKKLFFTIATVAAFSFANAQEMAPAAKQEPAKKTPAKTTTAAKKETTTSDKAATDAKPAGDQAPVAEEQKATTGADKKTRMAINEKGLPGEKKPATKSTTDTKSNPK